jgi:hypothetical protein
MDKVVELIWLKQKLSGLPKLNIAKTASIGILTKEVIKQP